MLNDFANGGGDWGAMNWYNLVAQNALDQLISSTNENEIYELSQLVAKAIYQDRPVIPISFYSQYTSVNNRVINFKFDPFERSYFINEMEFK